VGECNRDVCSSLNAGHASGHVEAVPLHLDDARMRRGLRDRLGPLCGQRLKFTIGAADKSLNDLVRQNSLPVARRDDCHSRARDDCAVPCDRLDDPSMGGRGTAPVGAATLEIAPDPEAPLTTVLLFGAVKPAEAVGYIVRTVVARQGSTISKLRTNVSGPDHHPYGNHRGGSLSLLRWRGPRKYVKTA
jgi:hypothetical protein